MKRILLGIFISTMLLSCGSRVKRHVAEYHDNGAPRLVTFYKYHGSDSLLVREEWYYPDSALRLEGSYAEGKKDGVWKAWYQDGTPWSIGEFRNGLSDGFRMVYHENGQLYYEGNYTKGKRSGHWEFFNSKGEKVKELDY